MNAVLGYALLIGMALGLVIFVGLGGFGAGKEVLEEWRIRRKVEQLQEDEEQTLSRSENHARKLLRALLGFIGGIILSLLVTIGLQILYSRPNLDVEWEAKGFQLEIEEPEGTSMHCVRSDAGCDQVIDLTDAEKNVWPKGVTTILHIESKASLPGLRQNSARLKGAELQTDSFTETAPQDFQYNEPEKYAFLVGDKTPSSNNAVVIVAPESDHEIDYLLFWYQKRAGGEGYIEWPAKGDSQGNRYSLSVAEVLDSHVDFTIRENKPLDLRFAVWLARPGNWRFKIMLLFESGGIRPFNLITMGHEEFSILSPTIEVASIEGDGITIALQDIPESIQQEIGERGDPYIATMLANPTSQSFVVNHPNIVYDDWLAFGTRPELSTYLPPALSKPVLFPPVQVLPPQPSIGPVIIP